MPEGLAATRRSRRVPARCPCSNTPAANTAQLQRMRPVTAFFASPGRAETVSRLPLRHCSNLWGLCMAGQPKILVTDSTTALLRWSSSSRIYIYICTGDRLSTSRSSGSPQQPVIWHVCVVFVFESVKRRPASPSRVQDGAQADFRRCGATFWLSAHGLVQACAAGGNSNSSPRHSLAELAALLWQPCIAAELCCVCGGWGTLVQPACAQRPSNCSCGWLVN